MSRTKVVGLLSLFTAVYMFSSLHTVAGGSESKEVNSSLKFSAIANQASAVSAIQMVAFTDLVQDKYIEETEKLDFTDQLVVFDVNDYESPVVYEDCHVTTYCNCESCCGVYAGKKTTATGAEAIEGITVAVDPKVIPYGSIVELDGHFYIAQDCGGAIKGVEIDVYIEDNSGKHSRCYQFMRDLGQDYGNTIRVWVPKQ